MAANRLHFHKQSAAAPVGSTQSGDTIVGVRGTDFINIPIGMIGGVPIRNWDAAASEVSVPMEVIPFTRTYEYSFGPEEWTVAPTTDVTKTTLSKPAMVDQDSNAAGQFAGHLPTTGKFWFIVGADAGIMDVNDDNWVEVYFSTKCTYVSTDLTSTVMDLGFGYDYGWLGQGLSFSDTTTGARKFLVCFDIDLGKIDIYASTGLTATRTVPAVNGQPALAGVFINFAFFNYNGAAGTLTFSTNGADTPYAIPSGYNPLTMLEADATAVTGKLNMVSSASVLRDTQLEVNHAYLIDDTFQSFEVPIAGVTAGIRKANIFSELQRFNKGWQGENGQIFRSASGGLVITGNNSNVVSRMDSLPGAWNIVLGHTSLQAMGAGQMNVVIGTGLAAAAITATHSVMLGYGMSAASYISDTVAIGRGVGGNVKKTEGTVLLGATAGTLSGYDLQQCTALGYGAHASFDDDPTYPAGTPTPVNGNTAVGAGAHYRGKPGNYNTVVGWNANTYYGTVVGATGVAEANTIMGANALSNRRGDVQRNVAVGYQSMMQCGTVDDNTFIGYEAGFMIYGNGNVGVGRGALRYATAEANSNSDCTAVGRNTMSNLSGIVNSTAVGANATVTGSNQVQLGDSATTAYTYGAVQNRSDRRDKREVRDTVLGLNFLLQLRPVDYKLDLREDYVDYSTRPQEPEALRPEPQAPQVEHTAPGYQELLTAYRADHDQWLSEKIVYDAIYRQWQRDSSVWDEANRMANIVTDGTKMRKRFHHGFIAQEVAAAAENMGIDFGGYQDHSINGGQDVRSLGYEEFVAPSIRAIQELYELVNSEEFVERIAAKVLDKMMAARTGG